MMSKDASNDIFEQCLAEAQEDFERAGSDWKPDASPEPYLCLLYDLRKGTLDLKDDKGQPTGRKYAFVQPVWRIAEGSFADAIFEGDLLSMRDQRSMRALKTFAETLTGESFEKPGDAVESVEGLVGLVVCRVNRVDNEAKDGRVFQNSRLAEVVEVLPKEAAA